MFKLTVRCSYPFFDIRSAMQKAIRRCNLDDVLFCAAEYDLSGLGNAFLETSILIAAEDVGLADPFLVTFLVQKHAEWKALLKRNKVKASSAASLLEARLIMMECAAAMALARKSRVVDTVYHATHLWLYEGSYFQLDEASPVPPEGGPVSPLPTQAAPLAVLGEDPKVVDIPVPAPAPEPIPEPKVVVEITHEPRVAEGIRLEPIPELQPAPEVKSVTAVNPMPTPVQEKHILKVFRTSLELKNHHRVFSIIQVRYGDLGDALWSIIEEFATRCHPDPDRIAAIHIILKGLHQAYNLMKKKFPLFHLVEAGLIVMQDDYEMHPLNLVSEKYLPIYADLTTGFYAMDKRIDVMRDYVYDGHTAKGRSLGRGDRFFWEVSSQVENLGYPELYKDEAIRWECEVEPSLRQP